MKRFSPSLAIFYFATILLGIIPGQSHQATAVAASTHDDMGWLHSEAPGVAFSLRPDYGTVAVKLRDQAPIVVARIEGSEEYKSLMRRVDAQPSDKVSHYNSWCPLYNSVAPRYLQDYLQYCRGNPDVDALQDLLSDLRMAVETHLGYHTCLVNIVVSEDIDGGYLGRVIDVAVANLGLTQALSREYHEDSALVLNVEDLATRFPEDPGLLVLLIQSSSSGAINLDLRLLDDTGSMTIREEHNITGTTIAPNCLNEDAPASCTPMTSQRRQAIRKGLTNITTPPFGELPWRGELPTSIWKILVYGDSQNDSVLQEELLTLFGPDLSAHAVVQQPEYATVRGGAVLAFFRINAIDYQVERPFWCCLRSWGKACPANHQRIDL